MPVILFKIDRAQMNLGAGRKQGVGPLHPRRQPWLSPTYTIASGTTRDGAGTALASCTVNVHRTIDGTLVDSLISDANGYWESRALSFSFDYFARAVSADGTKVGTTLNLVRA